MFTPEAIKLLSQTCEIQQANDQIADCDLAAIPAHLTLHDLEKYQPMRRRQRGVMTTSSIAAFAAYVQAQRDPEEGACAVFVDDAPMKAVAVLNLGTPARPGHCDNRAILEPEKTAAYSALLGIASGRPESQKAVAEWLEDWGPTCVRALTVDAEGEDVLLPLRRAISAIRSITIETARKVETEEASLSTTRSALEQVSAKSKADQLPEFFEFVCNPYHDLDSRVFRVRLGIVTTGDKLGLVLRVAKAEQHAQEMAQELADLVREAIRETAPVLLGAYSPTPR